MHRSLAGALWQCSAVQCSTYEASSAGGPQARSNGQLHKCTWGPWALSNAWQPRARVIVAPAATLPSRLSSLKRGAARRWAALSVATALASGGGPGTSGCWLPALVPEADRLPPLTALRGRKPKALCSPSHRGGGIRSRGPCRAATAAPKRARLPISRRRAPRVRDVWEPEKYPKIVVIHPDAALGGPPGRPFAWLGSAPSRMARGFALRPLFPSLTCAGRCQCHRRRRRHLPLRLAAPASPPVLQSISCADILGVLCCTVLSATSFNQFGSRWGWCVY